MVSARKILIETNTTETVRLRVTGPQAMRLFCRDCGAVEEMLDINLAADVSGTSARDLIRRIECGGLHSPDSVNGYLLVCRASLESEINESPRCLLAGGHWTRTTKEGHTR